MTNPPKRFRIEGGGATGCLPGGSRLDLGEAGPDRHAEAEVVRLRREFQAMAGAVEETRRQLAAVHFALPHDLTIGQIGSELGAVVGDTARATSTILAVAEEIAGIAGKLEQAAGTVPGNASEQLRGRVRQIFEACSFQDLTGQRIERIVETLGIIDRRVSRMFEIWGGEAGIGHLIAEEVGHAARERETDGSFGLVSGPRIGARPGHLDQSEIDALFE
jgi:chemotaxis protein CheZ